MSNPQLRQPFQNLYRLQTHANDLADQAHDILWILGAVGVVGDAAALVSLDAVLVDHPFEGGAVAKAVVEHFAGDAIQGEEAVVAQLRLVFGEAHLFDAPVERHIRRFDLCKREFQLLLIADVELGEAGAGGGKGAEVGGEGDAGQLALEVGLVAFAVAGVVQEAVDVVEDIPLGDGVVAVVGVDAIQHPVSDVLAAVVAVFVVNVEGEALGLFKHVKAWNQFYHPGVKGLVASKATDTDRLIFQFSSGVGNMDGNTDTTSFIIRSK